ncbi:serine recombinase [Alicyclobacillus contaminans]|uniref:recombinase family protein n=1 Tax=Alicyclobacillus contaminans TaxID=392016 RepID=UPI000406E2E5|nr:recombinase family protein [Alicyclobacillus contaminans]GMA50192.1 serine recombinase [Alicyclobacillus contaminans]
MDYPRNLQHVAIYLRKSRADIEAEARGEGETLAKHRRTLLALAKKYRYGIDDVFEEVVSGERIIDRPEMQQLLYNVRDGKFDAVLCMDIDRLGRGNMVDQGLIQDTFKSSGTLIITPRKVYDLQDELDEEWSEFEAFMARRELKIITRRLQRGRRGSAAEGKSISRKPPYGYLRDESLRLYPDPETAPVVRQIFQWAADGDGMTKISKRLMDMGIPTPSGRKVWDRRMIHEILTNPVYHGHIVWGRMKYQKAERGYIRMKQDESEWIVHENAHEALVDKETWERYQARIGKYAKVRVDHSLANPLSTLLYCAKCGRTMRRQKAYDRPHNTLLCKTYGCDARGAAFEIVEQRAIQMLKEIYRGMQFELHRTQHKEDSSPTVELLERRIKQLEQDIETLQSQRENLHDLLEQKVYDVDTFLARNKAIGERIEKAADELQRATSDLEQAKRESERQVEFVPRLAEVIEAYEQAQTAKEKNDLLKTVVERIEYYREKSWTKRDQFELKIYLKI